VYIKNYSHLIQPVIVLANTKKCKYSKNLFFIQYWFNVSTICNLISVPQHILRRFNFAMFIFLTYNRFLFVRKKILHVPCHYEVGRLRLSTAIPISSRSCSRCRIHHLNFIPPALSFTQEICPTTNKIERGYIVPPRAEINLQAANYERSRWVK